MQMHDFDIRVNDEPKYMVPIPTDDHHAIITPAVEGKESLRIPLLLHGVTSYFPTRKPTRQEYEQCEEGFRIELTSESIKWDPQATRFEEEEASMLDDKGRLQGADNDARRTIAAIYTIEREQPDEYLLDALVNTVHVQTTVCKGEAQHCDHNIEASKDHWRENSGKELVYWVETSRNDYRGNHTKGFANNVASDIIEMIPDQRLAAMLSTPIA
jgi:hypothetical protein